MYETPLAVVVPQDIYRESKFTPWILARTYNVKRMFGESHYIIYLWGVGGAITLVGRDECYAI
jgi:hypothetical protein